MNLVRSLTCVAVLGGTLALSAAPVAAAESGSYDVICVERTLPIDPEPFRVCVPYPL